MNKMFTQLNSVCITSIFRRKIKISVLLIATILLAGAGAFAQIKVTGTVTNSNGEALPGVSIRVKGDAIGVTTTENGRFIINVPNAKSVLVFTYVGYSRKEETVGTRTTIKVKLSESSNDLQEVVVVSTGYGGTARKSDLTGATSSVSSKEIQERQPVNLFDALQGKAAGVLITNDGGAEPGAEGSIQIRGTSTLNSGTGPLYLVDGVINPQGKNINPMDVESVEVLKDAASASIYGARAANGVILITTKKGIDGKPRFDLQYKHLFGKLANKYPLANANDTREFKRLLGGPLAVDSLNPSFNSDNDLQDLILGNIANRDEVNLNIGGGQKGLSYYTSLNYQDDKSIIVNSYSKNLQARINIGYQFSPKVKYSNNISFYWQNKNGISSADATSLNQLMRPLIERPSLNIIYYPDGSLTSYVGTKRNPLANATYETRLTQTLNTQFNNQVEFQVYKDLKFTNIFNVSLENVQGTLFIPRYVNVQAMNLNAGTNRTSKDFRWEYQSYLNFNKTVSTDHNFAATLGISADKRRFDQSQLAYQNAVSEELLVTFPAYIVQNNTFTDATANTGLSAFGRGNYSYKSRYIVAGVFRRDGSSRFGPENKFGNFYSGSAAWRFSDEKFMGWSKKFLDDAKIRASFGQVGNDRIDDFGSFTKISFSGSYNGVGGAGVNSVFGNPFIKWETVTQKNIGIDLQFLKGRLTFTADAYSKDTKDLLYKTDLPKETGFNQVTVNLGKIQNKGIEFAATGSPIVTGKFKWNIMANISFERSKILKLADGIPFVSGNKWYVEEGGRIGNFYGWKNLGTYQWNESNAYNDNWEKLTVKLGSDGKPLIENSKAKYTYNGEDYTGTVHNMYDPTGGKFVGGDTEWQNVKKDSLINDGDRHVIGNSQPDYYLGIFNNFTYKRFSFSFLFNASIGGEIYNTYKYWGIFQNSNLGAGLPELLQNSWRKQGDIATLPYYPNRTLRGNIKADGNSYFLESSSFIRLSSMRLSYQVPTPIAKKAYMKGLTAYIYGTNLAAWTNYTGFDPEFSSSNVLQPNEDNGKYPKRRELGLGLNINF